MDFNVVSTLPDAFTFRTVTTPSGKFGYVRIHTFYVPDDGLRRRNSSASSACCRRTG